MGERGVRGWTELLGSIGMVWTSPFQELLTVAWAPDGLNEDVFLVSKLDLMGQA